MSKPSKLSDVIKCGDTDVSLEDLRSQVATAAAEDQRFNQKPDGSTLGGTGVWVVDLVQDAGGSWKAVVQAADGCFYEVSFGVADGSVALGGDALEVARKTSWVEASFRYNGTPVAIEATWSDAAREASAESRRNGASRYAKKSDKAFTSSETAAAATTKAQKSGAEDDLWNASEAHMAAAEHHHTADFAATQAGLKGVQAFNHAKAAKDHYREAVKYSGMAASKGDKRLNGSDLLLCRDSGTPLVAADKWEMDKPARFQWMPGGVNTISAGWNDRPINVTVECDEQAASTVQSSLERWTSQFPKQKPFGCVEHREEEASLYPQSFAWADDPEPGIFCTAMPSELGARNVNGRIHRSWSPSFTSDAEYDKAVCADCAKPVVKCKAGCRGGVTFPVGARGHKDTPARITGVGFDVGSLTNKPAFKNILPVRAKEAGTGGKQAPQPGANNNADTKGPSTMKLRVKLIKARGAHAAGAFADLEGDEAIQAIASGDAVDEVTAQRLENQDKQIKAQADEKAATAKATIKARVKAAKDRGAVEPKDEAIEAKALDRIGKGVDLETVVELIDALPGKDLQTLTARTTQFQNDQNGNNNILSSGIQLQGCDPRDAGSAYVKAREPMDGQMRGGKWGDSFKASLESCAILSSHIMQKIDAGASFLVRDLLRAADVTDANVGTIATGLILMRNLGFLKNKLGFLPYISTDLRNEPALFNQPVFTRYITPPAVVDFNTTTGWADSTPSATDVTVTMNKHKGVQVTFQTQLLGSTTRALFSEQQGAQFYSLAEQCNKDFLTTVFGATWTGVPASYTKALLQWDIKGLIGIKNALTLQKVPDVGRFLLMHSVYHDKILEDSNLLNAKAILSLINKDATSFNDGSLPVLFGLKPLESQLAAATTGVLGSITDPANLGTINQVGFAGNMSSMLFVARIPQDYTTVLPGIPSTASIEIVTEPDSGLSIMMVKYLNHQLANVTARCALMYGFAQGDPRQGLILKPGP